MELETTMRYFAILIAMVMCSSAHATLTYYKIDIDDGAYTAYFGYSVVGEGAIEKYTPDVVQFDFLGKLWTQDDMNVAFHEFWTNTSSLLDNSVMVFCSDFSYKYECGMRTAGPGGWLFTLNIGGDTSNHTFGWRDLAGNLQSTDNVTLIQVDGIPVPEPTTILLVLGMLGIFCLQNVSTNRTKRVKVA